jgi:hypothetical protein
MRSVAVSTTMNDQHGRNQHNDASKTPQTAATSLFSQTMCHVHTSKQYVRQPHSDEG